MSARPALVAACAAALCLASPSVLACDAQPPPPCEGSGCSAKLLLRDVDVVLRKAGGCKVDPAPGQKPGKPVLLERLKGKRESTVLPASVRHEASFGPVS